MTLFSSSLKNQALSGFNKAQAESIQLLLKTSSLLKSRYFFIGLELLNKSKRRSMSRIQLLFLLADITTWLGHVIVVFLGISNKVRSFFLIPKFFAIAHSSSYLSAPLAPTRFLFSFVIFIKEPQL